MQPLSLRRRLEGCGLESTPVIAWLFSRTHEARKVKTGYLRRCSSLMVMIALVDIVAIGAMRHFGVPIAQEEIAAGAIVGVALGVALRLANGMAGAVSLGVVLGAGMGAAGAEIWVAIGGVALVAAAVVAGAVAGTVAGTVPEAVEGVTFGVLVGLALGVVFRLALGVVLGVAGIGEGLFLSFAFLAFLLRLPMLLIEVPLQANLVRRHRNLGESTLNLRASPIFWHELSYLPLPCLCEHIESTAQDNPELARSALRQCAIIPGQRGTGLQAQERLRLNELESLGHKRQFAKLLDGKTLWQTSGDDPEQDATRVLLMEIARSIRAADLSLTRQQRIRQYEEALDQIGIVASHLPAKASELMESVVHAWRGGVEHLLEEARSTGEGSLPNPFRAGEALEPSLGSELFRGREEVVRRIENLLSEPNRPVSIALLAPRRCGKTSVLKMLSHLLPDAVCIFFDLQGHPVSSPRAFFEALDQETRKQALRDRSLRLPRFGDGPPFEAATAWIGALEEAAGERRILLCLDEFETLEASFPNENGELRQLMGLLRATIQHRRKIRILVSGEAPFDELGDLWYDHFISVRELRLEHLDPETALDLIRHPTSEFPPEAMPEDVAKIIAERTDGQPFLVQLYAHEWVELLNEEERNRAEVGDLDTIEKRVLESATNYFRNRWTKAPPAAQHALATLARGETLTELERAARRWLQHRALIDEDLRLRIPVFGRFLVEEELV